MNSLEEKNKIKDRFERIHRSGVIPWRTHDPKPEITIFFNYVKDNFGVDAVMYLSVFRG